MKFVIDFAKKLNFPEEAVIDIEKNVKSLKSLGIENKICTAINDFYNNSYDWHKAEPCLNKLADESGIHCYSIYLIFLLSACKRLKANYEDKRISHQIFLGTMEDLKAKLLECHEVHGVWGTFVPFWYSEFFALNIFKLGRLEYENIIFEQDFKYEKNGVLLKNGKPVKSIHIPSSFGPLDYKSRLESYKLAYSFFKDELNGGPLVCICESWLLHNSTVELVSQSSNILDFYKDFYILNNDDKEEFSNAWRVFGSVEGKNIEDWQEKTSMQRAYKKYLISGKKTGNGLGVLVFDGKEILTRKK